MSRAEKNPNHQVSMSALEAFGNMLCSGQLPSIAKGEHGTMTSSGFNLLDDTTDYPVSRTYEVQKKGDTEYTYRYTFSQETATSVWKLVEAWRTGIEGDREELPFPVE